MNGRESRLAMRELERYVLDEKANEIFLLWQHRIVPYRAYLKGFKVSSSFYLNQDLGRIWLDK